jgi:hypothetical protein
LVTQNGEVDERRSHDGVLGVLVAAEDESQDRDKEQQQREDSHKRDVGERGRERATPVVAELADHRHHERDRGMALLVHVDGPDRPLERARARRTSRRGSLAHTEHLPGFASRTHLTTVQSASRQPALAPRRRPSTWAAGPNRRTDPDGATDIA